MRVGWFAVVCRRKGLKVIAGKSKMLVLNGEVPVDEIRLENLSKSGIDGTVCSRKVASGRRVAGAIRSLINDGMISLSVLEFCTKQYLFPKELM